jgi:hypothetical protein
MTEKIEAGQNISTPAETELTPLEKARKHIVDWLKGDPTIDPLKSQHIQVINKELFEVKSSFIVASADFKKELRLTSPAFHDSYLQIAQRLAEIKKQDLERRRKQLSLLNSEAPEYLIYDTKGEVRQINGNLHPGFIVRGFRLR